MKMKNADLNELESLYQIEYKSFQNDAVSKEQLKKRIKDHHESFFVLYEKDKVISFLQGIKIDTDEITYDIVNSNHSYGGNIFLLQTLATSYSYRHRGYASFLLNSVINTYKNEGIKKIILVCSESLKTFYEKFDFKYIKKDLKCASNKVWIIMEREL